MRGIVGVMAALCGCMQSAGAFAPVPQPMMRLTPAGFCSSASLRDPRASSVTMAARSWHTRRELLESAKRGVMLTGLSPLFQASATEAFSVPAGAMQGGKVGELDGFVQGVVLECENLEDELAFWTQGLKMKVLRRSAGRIVVGYGAESLSQESGAHFSVELVQARGESKSLANIQLQLKLPAQILKSIL